MTSLEITVILGIEKITEMSPVFLPNLLISSPSSITPLSTTLFLFYLFRISQAVVLLQHVYWPLLASTCNPFKAQPCWSDRYKVSIRARRGEKEVFTWCSQQNSVNFRGASWMFGDWNGEANRTQIKRLICLFWSCHPAWDQKCGESLCALVCLRENYMLCVSAQAARGTVGLVLTPIILKNGHQWKMNKI